MRYVLLLIVISFIIGSCRKDEVFTSAPSFLSSKERKPVSPTTNSTAIPTTKAALFAVG